MDLLGSILGSMNGPPTSTLTEKEKETRRKQKLLNEKLEEKRKIQVKKFRMDTEKVIDEFVKSANSVRFKKFEPMSKYHRSVVHDIAEIAGLTAHSFGVEDADRHIVIWKKEFSPSEDELECLRRGEAYDPEVIKQRRLLEEEYNQKRKEEEKRRPEGGSVVPKTNYLDKFEHLIGKETEVIKAEMKKSYGMVSAESKKDKRTVEQVQAELRAKKKAKLG